MALSNRSSIFWCDRCFVCLFSFMMMDVTQEILRFILVLPQKNHYCRYRKMMNPVTLKKIIHARIYCAHKHLTVVDNRKKGFSPDRGNSARLCNLKGTYQPSQQIILSCILFFKVFHFVCLSDIRGNHPVVQITVSFFCAFWLSTAERAGEPRKTQNINWSFYSGLMNFSVVYCSSCETLEY